MKSEDTLMISMTTTWNIFDLYNDQVERVRPFMIFGRFAGAASAVAREIAIKGQWDMVVYILSAGGYLSCLVLYLVKAFKTTGPESLVAPMHLRYWINISACMLFVLYKEPEVVASLVSYMVLVGGLIVTVHDTLKKRQTALPPVIMSLILYMSRLGRAGSVLDLAAALVGLAVGSIQLGCFTYQHFFHTST